MVKIHSPLKLKYFLRYIFRIIYEFTSRYVDVQDIIQTSHQEKAIKDINNAIINKGFNVLLYGSVNIISPRFLSLGNNVKIFNNARLDCAGGIFVGDNTVIDENVCIFSRHYNCSENITSDEYSKLFKPVFIGNNVFIGCGTKVLPGLTIGEGAKIGINCLIQEDVPANSYIGTADTINFKGRKFNRIIDADPQPFSLENSSKPVEASLKTNLLKKGKKVFFVVGTGRSGSMTIARILNQHSQIACCHEATLCLIRLSSEYAHGRKSQEQVSEELIKMFHKTNIYPEQGYYGESNQKLSNLIEPITDILPEAKFVWLIRRADTCVSSMYSRGWFSAQPKHRTYKLDIGGEHWFHFRLNGAESKVFTEEQWQDMSRFEKCCWYWSHWNENIAQQLDDIDQSRSIMVRLEELNSENVNRIVNFLELEDEKIHIETHNTSLDKLIKPAEWTNNQACLYNKWCSEKMQKWYP